MQPSIILSASCELNLTPYPDTLLMLAIEDRAICAQMYQYGRMIILITHWTSCRPLSEANNRDERRQADPTPPVAGSKNSHSICDTQS